jgi:Lrp/AsnC family leucine-responsive transcriptional regulator
MTDLRISDQLDNITWKLVAALQDNARLSFSELGRLVGLTPPAVAERVRRLQDVGVIQGYRAIVNVAKLGLPLQAIIRFAARGRSKSETSRQLGAIHEIMECHHVTGDDCYVLRVAVPDTEHLEKVIDRLLQFGDTTTSIVLSTTIAYRGVTTETIESVTAG